MVVMKGMCRLMGKYDVDANRANTPHFYERLIVRALLCVFMGLNVVLALALYVPMNAKNGIYIAIASVIGLGCASMAILDIRRDMVRWSVIAFYGVIYIALAIRLAVALNEWRLSIIYVYEVASILAVAFGLRLIGKRKR